MILEERIKYILRKYPATRFNRAEFMWKYMEEYHGVKVYALKSQFLNFWQEEAGLERKLRDVLKDPEFMVSPEQDQARYEKAAEIKKEYKSWKKKLSPEDKEKFEKAFGGDTEEEKAKRFSQTIGL